MILFSFILRQASNLQCRFLLFFLLRFPANKKSRPPRLLFRRGRAFFPWYHLYLPFACAKKPRWDTCHIPGAVSGAPVFAYHLRFSKPLGKEFAAPASAASHQTAAL
jgi:hypothetical protein